MIRVLVADDHAVVREGLKQILTKSGDLSVAADRVCADERVQADVGSAVDEEIAGR